MITTWQDASTNERGAKTGNLLLVSIQELLEAGILRALDTLTHNGDLPAGLALPTELTLERPKNRDHGDYATSIALALAKSAGKQPRDIAQALQGALLDDP